MKYLIVAITLLALISCVNPKLSPEEKAHKELDSLHHVTDSLEKAFDVALKKKDIVTASEIYEQRRKVLVRSVDIYQALSGDHEAFESFQKANK